MEVIHISPSYKPAYEYGGPTMSVSQLCEHLQKCDLKLRVLTTTANGKAELAVSTGILYSIAGVPVRYFSRITGDHSHLSPGLNFHLLKVLWRAKKESTPCIIHVHSWWNLVAILSCLAGRIFKLPVVVSPRGMLTTYSFGHQKSLLKRTGHAFLGRWLLQGSHIHATSEQEKKDILCYVKPKSMVVLPNLVDLPTEQSSLLPNQRVLAPRSSHLRPKPSHPAHSRSHVADIPTKPFHHRQECNSEPMRPFKLIYFSRIDRKKGVELLLLAATSLRIDFTLTLAGTGTKSYVEELKELAKVLGISKWIQWTGHVSNQDKYALLMEHDLLVLPSRNENFANVVVESLAVGTAVLVSEEVGLADYIVTSQLGWVCSLCAADLATQIEVISTQKEILAQIRLDGPKRIYSDFHQQNLATQYVKFYKRILES